MSTRARKPPVDAIAGMPLVPCDGCKKKVLWVVIDDQRICLDVVPAVYRVFAPSPEYSKPIAERAGQRPTPTYIGPYYYVSHFATCPKAADFSGRGK